MTTDTREVAERIADAHVGMKGGAFAGLRALRVKALADAIDEALSNERERHSEVAQIAQGVLTALNVGDVQSGSPLHLKLREVMIAYRTRIRRNEGSGTSGK